MRVFGPHLHVDARTRLTPDHLRSIPFWETFLRDLVATAEMRVLHGPVVVDSACSNPAWDPPDVTGLSGFVVLAESHASFHTFAEARFVFLDVFSCKPWPASFADWIVERLALDPVQVHTTPRYWE